MPHFEVFGMMDFQNEIRIYHKLIKQRVIPAQVTILGQTLCCFIEDFQDLLDLSDLLDLPDF